MLYQAAAVVVLFCCAGAPAQVTTLSSPLSGNAGAFGADVAGIGDINGDGRGDAIVGAAFEDSFGVVSAGQVHVYSGASGARIRTLVSPARDQDGDFGAVVASVPDTNGDGKPDILVGADAENPGASPQDCGRAYLFSGATGSLLFKFASPIPFQDGEFGYDVAGIGDINGDGRGDVIIGAAYESSPAPGGGFFPRTGRVHVYSGATGVRIRTLVPPNQSYQMYFGTAVASVPDANGDGKPDILVGMPRHDGMTAYGSGQALLYSGATGVLLRVFNSPVPFAMGAFGADVDGIPDVNGDGRGDVVIGAPFEHPGASPSECGRAYIFSGATGQLLFKLVPPMPEAGGWFGFSVAGIGDLNGDGRGDVVVGAMLENPGGSPSDCGRVHVYSGATGVRIKTLASLHPLDTGLFGACVGAVPDVNGNVRPEIVVGAPGEGGPSANPGDGRAYIFRN